MNIKIFAAALTVTFALASCGTPKEITYFQDAYETTEALTVSAPVEITLQPKDKISIIVSTQNTQLTNQFNLPIISQQVGMAETSYTQSRGLSGYTVDSQGDIDFPVLGKIHVAGLTREQVAQLIKRELIEHDLVKDPVVTVEFMNLAVTVMGEVNHPGRININKDNITVLDAISEAGDLTIFGERKRVMVLRQEGNQQRVYNIDLTSAQDVYASPAYYLHQNDMVYVEPNDNRKRQSTVNGNNIRSTSFWISLASLLTSVCVLIFK